MNTMTGDNRVKVGSWSICDINRDQKSWKSPEHPSLVIFWEPSMDYFVQKIEYGVYISGSVPCFDSLDEAIAYVESGEI